jgi:ligand-binding sensor domain-containing protein
VPIVLVAVCGARQLAIAPTALPSGPRTIERQGGLPPVRDLKFARLTTNDGLSQDRVFAIMQDRLGFMWLSTGEGLNRYDGHSFVVYKNDPRDSGSLSDNGTGDVFEDKQGFLWVAAYPGINKFDPRTERSTRYLHDPANPNSFGSHSVSSIGADSRGHLWFGTMDDGLDRFDLATETFTHYRNDSAGRYVGWVRRVIEDREGEIWFVGDRGLFHVNQQTGQVARAAPTLERLTAFDVFEDSTGDFWLLATSPSSGDQYDRRTGRFAEYPLDAGAIVLDNSKLLDDGGTDSGCRRRLGSLLDRRGTPDAPFPAQDNPNSLSDSGDLALPRSLGLLWVGTANGG